MVQTTLQATKDKNIGCSITKSNSSGANSPAAPTSSSISIAEILRNKASPSSAPPPHNHHHRASAPTGGDNTDVTTSTRSSKTDYTSIDFASILDSVSSISIPDSNKAKLENISHAEKMQYIPESLSGEASVKLQELMSSSKDVALSADKVTIEKLLELHKKKAFGVINKMEEKLSDKKKVGEEKKLQESTRKKSGKKLLKAQSHGEGSLPKPRSRSPRRQTTMATKATVEEREAAARELVGGSSSSSTSSSEPKEKDTKFRHTTKTTMEGLSTSSHHDAKRAATSRGRRSSSPSPPAKSRHSKTTNKGPLSTSSHDGKNVYKLKGRPKQISRSVSPDFELECPQNEPSSSNDNRERKRATAKPNRCVSPRRVTVHGKKLTRKTSADGNDSRRKHRHTKHHEGISNTTSPKRSSGGHHHRGDRCHEHQGAASRGRGSDTTDDRRRSSSHGPARRTRGSGGLIKQRSMRSNLGRQHPLRGLARQESMKQNTLKNILSEPMGGLSESEDEQDDNLHLYRFSGVKRPVKADQSSMASPRTSTAPRLTAASLRQRLNGGDNAAEDTADDPRAGTDEEEDREFVSGSNEKVVLPFGDDEVERKKKESARQAAAKDRPQFADLHDDF